MATPLDQHQRSARAQRRAGRMLLAFVFVGAFAGNVARAAEAIAASHDHALLPEDASLTLAAVLKETLSRYPSTRELAAQAEEAQAWTKRGTRWLADAASLSFRYQSDRWWDNNGLDEYESGIELPLWRWGERDATRSLGQTLTVETQASTAALHWEVAGLLREALWSMALAASDLTLAEAALNIATELTASVTRRKALGDVSMSDLLLAQTAQLETQTAVIETRAAMLDAERGYRSLTTLDQRPAFSMEATSARAAIEPDHPALTLVAARLRRAEANHRRVQQAAKGSPTLLVGSRRERAPFGNQFDSSIGMTITVPIGGAVHTRAKSAAASREVAAARANRDRVLRALDLQMHEAAHSLAVVAQNLAAAEQRAALAGQHFAMGQRAYEYGELDLLDLLKLQNTSLAARRQVARLQLQQKRQSARYNQAVGVLP